MKIWDTKYALTVGIVEREVESCETPDGQCKGMVSFHTGTNQTGANYLHSSLKEWHVTEDDAIKRALEMAAKKLVSIQKKAKKIEMIQAQLRNRRDQILKNA